MSRAIEGECVWNFCKQNENSLQWMPQPRSGQSGVSWQLAWDTEKDQQLSGPGHSQGSGRLRVPPSGSRVRLRSFHREEALNTRTSLSDQMDFCSCDNFFKKCLSVIQLQVVEITG